MPGERSLMSTTMSLYGNNEEYFYLSPYYASCMFLVLIIHFTMGVATGNSSYGLRSLQAAASEASALLDLLQGSSGQSYASSATGWDTTTPVCDWDGITCDLSGNVQVVDVQGASLEGTIPSSLGSVSSIEQLFLGSNSFNGPIPNRVVMLPNLNILDLSFNSLDGPIPFPMSQSLQTIHLGHNELTGNLPETFANNLQALRIFDIKYNRLGSTIPTPEANLPAITSLDLSNNNFIGPIPPFFGELTSLTRLYLSNNLLSGLIPAAIGNNRIALRELFIHGNKLTGTIPASLADIPDLQTLFVDDNELTGFVPAELCAMDLNEEFFHDSGGTNVPDVDSTFEDLYGSGRTEGQNRRRRKLQRESDPTSERDGCTSIACPAGYKSSGAGNKDGVFPCELCNSEELNPYIGSNRCFESNQESALSALYVATNGGQWTGATNWGDPTVASCDKEGVTCSDSGHIVSIDLENKGLSGTIPADIGFLDRLTSLNLSHNRIAGQIPADLRFAPLEMFDVAENKITGFVPTALCVQAGINGNGQDGIFTCDTIACGVGTHTSKGRADAGIAGEKCRFCVESTDPFLGTIDCVDKPPETDGITPFGLVGEISIAIFGLTMIGVVIWVWKRHKVSSQYITDRAYFVHGPGKDEAVAAPPGEGYDNDFGAAETDPLAGIEGITDVNDLRNLEIKVKDEWNNGKEQTTQKEVWLDVPKIS